jgi:hypothetical protein
MSSHLLQAKYAVVHPFLKDLLTCENHLPSQRTEGVCGDRRMAFLHSAPFESEQVIIRLKQIEIETESERIPGIRFQVVPGSNAPAVRGRNSDAVGVKVRIRLQFERENHPFR